jgi:hypothetical protein
MTDNKQAVMYSFTIEGKEYHSTDPTMMAYEIVKLHVGTPDRYTLAVKTKNGFNEFA